MAKLNQICINGDCSETPNAFAKVNVDGTVLSADSNDDTLNVEAGTNITLTPNIASDTVEISAPNVYNKTEVDNLISGVGGLKWVKDVDGSGQTSLQGVVENDVEDNVVTGSYAHAEGTITQATGTAAHAEGRNTQATNLGAHSEGEATTASGYAAHAEGESTQASEYTAHAEGYTSVASGRYSHAEGEYNIASGTGSHAEGYNNDARGDYQHVGGKFAEYDDNDTYAVMIGNGTSSSNRKNAFALDWNGNATFDGRVDADNVGIHYIASGNQNLNNYTTEGVWYFSGGATLTNAPNGAVNGWLEVLPSMGGDVKQFWHRHGSNPTTFKDEYIRLYGSGSWGSWEKIATESDIAGAFDTTQTVETNRIIRTTKLPDGTMICSMKVNITTAISGTWGAIYYSPLASLGNWPTAFIATPVITATLDGGPDAWVGTIRNTSTTFVGSTYLYRAVAQVSSTYSLSVIAIGRWQ